MAVNRDTTFIANFGQVLVIKVLVIRQYDVIAHGESKNNAFKRLRLSHHVENLQNHKILTNSAIFELFERPLNQLRFD